MTPKYLFIIMAIIGLLVGLVIITALFLGFSDSKSVALLTDESRSEIIRNYGIIAFGVLGFFFAGIRLLFLDRQHVLAKRSALFDRFQKSSAMLSDDNIAIRQAGIFSLTEIAMEEPDEFYILVQSLFCGFLRHASNELREHAATEDQNLAAESATRPEWPEPRADMVDALNSFGKLRQKLSRAKGLETGAEYKPNLSGLFVPGFKIVNQDFEDCDLRGAVFSDSYQERNEYYRSNLDHSNFDRAEINFCTFRDLAIKPWSVRFAQFHGGEFKDSHAVEVNDEHSFAAGFEILNGVIDVVERNKDSDLVASFPAYTDLDDYDLAKDVMQATEQIYRK